MTVEARVNTALSKIVWPDNKHAEDLAQRLLAQLDGAWCVKLKERKTEIEELLVHFKNLRGGTIAGCKNWDEFCQRKLHRTARAVRKMLADRKPSQANEQQSHAEQSSASPTAEEPFEAGDENSQKEGTESGQQKTAKEISPLSKVDEEKIAERIARDQAVSKTTGYLSKFDSAKEFRAKFADFLRELREEFSDSLAPELWDRLVQVLESKGAVSEPPATVEEVAV